MADETPAQAPTPVTTSWPKWIQLFVVYPALGTSLFAAVPRVWEEYKALRLGVARSELQLAQEQERLWQRNLECIQEQGTWEIDGPHGIVVRATLCSQTGDVLLRYHVGEWPSIYRWMALPVEKVKKP
jgi:hypothetical protein